MNKELVKKLHEAGFPNLAMYRHDFIEEPNDNPFKTGWDIKATCKLCGEKREYSSGGWKTSDYNHGCTVVSDYTEPTLEELIQACGDRFTLLRRVTKGEWECGKLGECGYVGGDEDNGYCLEFITDSVGSTPEEAVANLYLALFPQVV